MPQQWSNKYERQYDKIRNPRGIAASPSRAKEIAARTVNKERARSGESNQASRSPQGFPGTLACSWHCHSTSFARPNAIDRHK